jgi:signal transduction histidine kinase
MNARRHSWIGVLTWLVIAIPSVIAEAERHTLFTQRAAVAYSTFLLFLVCFLFATREGCNPLLRIPLIVLQSLAGLTCALLQPWGFMPVLLVIVAAQLGFFPLRIALPAITVNSLLLGLVVRQNSGPALAYTLVYFAFSMFALFTMHVAHAEADARQALAQTNAELKVTTGLLEISGRTSERLRIARDLHDLLGHHLTALSLNLEVASHLAEGPAKESIAKSQSIAKQLLTDVREVVGRLRNDDPVDLTASLESLRGVVSAPALHLDYERELSVSDPGVAQVALRTVQEIVTNAMRHSGARNLWVKLTTHDDALSIHARDDGNGAEEVRFGNGLRGLRERVEQARGTLEVDSTRGRGFSVQVTLPLGERA